MNYRLVFHLHLIQQRKFDTQYFLKVESSGSSYNGYAEKRRRIVKKDVTEVVYDDKKRHELILMLKD